MALLYSPSAPTMSGRSFTPSPLLPSFHNTKGRASAPLRKRVAVCAFFNPFQDKPILKDALKEPVAFMGGVFAGLLRLDLNEEPLKDWIASTVEASGIATEVESGEGELETGGEDGAPQQIEIE